ncbi:MAG: flavodoxin family protein [Actinobacteria bacterium]|nr:flavodoxin family protein [Actinomycetota bacterium]MCG2806675.1 flavodoxin family protein [Coriobacteriia bacterium]
MTPELDTPIRVLCVAGSPRRTGNSTAMLDACIGGIEGAGGVADRLALAEFHVHPCSGCGQCSSMGQCVVNDDMHDIYPRIDAADAIVIASPVYFAGVPATLKAFYDRCQPYWARRYILKVPPREPRRPGALMIVRGGGDPYGSECAVTTTRSVFAVLETELGALLDIEGPDLPGEISGHQGALMDAEELGRRIAALA